MYQLCSGHIPLNAYLHRFKLVKSAQCPTSGAPRETLQHFVLECPAYDHKCRRTLKPKGGRSELKYAEILGKKNKAMVLAHYIMDTGKFDREVQEHNAGGRVEEEKRNRETQEEKNRWRCSGNPSWSGKS